MTKRYGDVVAVDGIDLDATAMEASVPRTSAIALLRPRDHHAGSSGITGERPKQSTVTAAMPIDAES